MYISNTQEEIWREIAESGYGDVVKLTTYQNFYEKLGSLFEECPGGTILEGGCGPGALFPFILEGTKAGKVVAVDFCDDMLKLAKEKAKCLGTEKFNFRKLDLSKKPLPFPDDFFDGIVFSLILQFLPDREWEKLLRQEAYRVCKPGGYIYIAVQTKDYTSKFNISVIATFLRDIFFKFKEVCRSLGVKEPMKKLCMLAEDGVLDPPARKEVEQVLTDANWTVERVITAKIAAIYIELVKAQKPI